MFPRSLTPTTLGAPRAATPLELLFDLCFVVAVAQAADRLHHALVQGHIADGVVSQGSVYFAIWWAWMNFTWFAPAYDTDDVPYRLLTLLQIGGVLMAAGWRTASTARTSPSYSTARRRGPVHLAPLGVRLGYWHLLVFASLAAVGAGLQVVAETVDRHGSLSGRAASLTLAVPVALFLVVLGLLHSWVYR